MPTIIGSGLPLKGRSKKKRVGQVLREIELQRRLEDIELATVSAVRALQMDVAGDEGTPSATVLRKARQAIR
jgi:hypothetical protein